MTDDQFEASIRALARQMPYPPMPRRNVSLARKGRFRTLRSVAMLLLIAGVFSLGLPQIRAAVQDLLQIGAVRIYLDGRTAEGLALKLDDVSGEVDFQDARALVSFELLTFPDDPPDRVFVQDADLVIFVWTTRDSIQAALYQTRGEGWQIVKAAETVTMTQLGDQEAYWVSLQAPVQFLRDGEIRTELTHFVSGNVLGWVQDGVTYRLETSLALPEARALAESLVPVQS